MAQPPGKETRVFPKRAVSGPNTSTDALTVSGNVLSAHLSALLDLAAGGAALIVISQDLDELMESSDRFAALNEGRLSAPRPAKGLTVDEIGMMLGGADAAA